jgi:hypothetical protein
VHIGDIKVLALIDSGSTTTFVDPSLVTRANLPVTNHALVKVTVVNGNILWTHAICANVSCSIHGHDFSSTFRVLELQGYDIILGCDWIYDYSPVGINLKTRQFTLEKNGKKITLNDETLPNKDFLTSHKKMNVMLRKGSIGAIIYVQKLQIEDTSPTTSPELVELLENYIDVFQEPTELPPEREGDHRIPLQPESAVVNSRPYRLSFTQKDTMESLVRQLLNNNIIR